MLKAELGKEIVIKGVNDIGVLADVSQIIGDKGIDIRAAGCWVEGANGLIHLVTDDNLRAVDALRKAHFDVHEDKVVMAELPHKPGMLKHMAQQLKKERIDIRHLYVSADGVDKSLVVFSSSNNDHAMVTINKN